MKIGLAIKLARESKKMSQWDVAIRVGCPRSYISKIECGFSEPTLRNIIRIGQAIDIEAWRILRYASRHESNKEYPVDSSVNHTQPMP